jgi:hypothetical protein
MKGLFSVHDITNTQRSYSNWLFKTLETVFKCAPYSPDLPFYGFSLFPRQKLNIEGYKWNRVGHFRVIKMYTIVELYWNTKRLKRISVQGDYFEGL